MIKTFSIYGIWEILVPNGDSGDSENCRLTNDKLKRPFRRRYIFIGKQKYFKLFWCECLKTFLPTIACTHAFGLRHSNAL